MVLKYSVYKGNQGELLQESFPSAACQYVLDVLPHAGSGSRQQKSLLAVHRQDLSLTWLQHNTLLSLPWPESLPTASLGSGSTLTFYFDEQKHSQL